MYTYRTLSSEERHELVEERLSRGYPPHQPPHPNEVQGVYLLTAACYEHRHHMITAEHRDDLLDLIFEQCFEKGITLTAWGMLTNHYHLLAEVPHPNALGELFQRIHGRTAHDWNAEEDAQSRKVWYRYADRLMRSGRHYYATLNCVHYNAVKHGLVTSPYDWKWSSVHWYLAHLQGVASRCVAELPSAWLWQVLGRYIGYVRGL